MDKSHLLKYLLISPNLPVGGFCYSEGFESYFDIKNMLLNFKVDVKNKKKKFFPERGAHSHE